METKPQLHKKIKHHAKQHWLTVAFVLGFIFDNLTLTRVDRLFDNIVLSSYVLIAMLSIIVLYASIAERFYENVNIFFKRWAPIIMQYAFGGLLSGMLIFFGRSGSLLNSWPFLLMILSVIYGNETIKNRQSRLVYNITIFFIGLFAYMILIVPVVLGKMGPSIFLMSGGLTLFIMYTFFHIIEKIVPNFIQLQKRNVVFIIGLIYVMMNFLYFANIIPPIPLSLKEMGVYHAVALDKTSGIYTLTYEKPAWWKWYLKADDIFHYTEGESVFCYSSVFAPSRLAVEVFHRWEYYDDTKQMWKTYAYIPYAIQGGRNEGYRGYSKITGYHEGVWRCTVETARGQVIGKETFTIASGVRAKLVTRTE